jgi:hypothetical protein
LGTFTVIVGLAGTEVVTVVGIGVEAILIGAGAGVILTGAGVGLTSTGGV